MRLLIKGKIIWISLEVYKAKKVFIFYCVDKNEYLDVHDKLEDMVLNHKMNTSKNKKQMEHHASWTAKSSSVFYFVFIGQFNYENYERKKKQPAKVSYPSNTVPFQSSVDTDHTKSLTFLYSTSFTCKSNKPGISFSSPYY